MSKNEYKNFWEYYIQNISPKLEQIDVLIKERVPYISQKTAATLLNLTRKEICEIMYYENITQITSSNFLSVMLKGNSYLCNILRKELELNSPTNYTPNDLSYIYDIDYAKIKSAFHFLNINKISSANLKAIFVQITNK